MKRKPPDEVLAGVTCFRREAGDVSCGAVADTLTGTFVPEVFQSGVPFFSQAERVKRASVQKSAPRNPGASFSVVVPGRRMKLRIRGVPCRGLPSREHRSRSG